MSIHKPWLRRILAWGGGGLMFAGLAAAYYWMYWLAPMRHLNDPAWLAQSSEARRWEEEQKSYHRTGRSPDLCFKDDRIGYYGNADWFFWLEERIRHPESFRHCGCTESALALMTNHNEDSWESWTQANRHRSQEEWIKDGFARYGVEVHLPPKQEDAVPLLRLLARPSWKVMYWGAKRPEEAPPDALPDNVKYNAFRWLRDLGFKLDSDAAKEPLTAQGLLQYYRWLAGFPGIGGVGVLSFGKKRVDTSLDEPQPILNRPWASAGIYALIGLSTLGGGWLMVRFGRRSTREVPKSRAQEPAPDSEA